MEQKEMIPFIIVITMQSIVKTTVSEMNKQSVGKPRERHEIEMNNENSPTENERMDRGKKE